MVNKLKDIYNEIRSEQKPCDFLVVILVLILAIFGIVMVFSASYYKSINETGTAYSFLKKQTGFVAIGCVFMWLFSRVDYHRFRKWGPGLLLAGLIMLGLIFTPLGQSVNGATRWLNVGFTIMPGELVKPILILFTAGVLAANDTRKNKWPIWFMLIFIGGLCAVLIFFQPNLSTAITVVGIVGCMMLLAGFPLWLAGGLQAMLIAQLVA
jgi:cell division protein FtsW